MRLQFQRQRGERFCSFAMLFRLMQAASDFQSDRNLGRQGPGPAHVLLRDPCIVQAVKHAKHAQHFPIGIEKRHGQKLPHFEFRQHFQIEAGN